MQKMDNTTEHASAEDFLKFLGAVVAFISFLLWVIRLLIGELKRRETKERALQIEVRELMRETINESNKTNRELAQELKTRRKAREEV